MNIEFFDIMYHNFDGGNVWLTEGVIRILVTDGTINPIFGYYLRERIHPLCSYERLKYYVWYDCTKRSESERRRPDLITPYEPEAKVKWYLENQQCRIEMASS